MKRWCNKCHSVILQQEHICNKEKRPTTDITGLGIVPPVRSNWFHQVDPLGLGFAAVFMTGVILWRSMW
jgi:hypothetical protein